MVTLWLLQKGKKSKSIGIRYEYHMSVRTFVRSRVSEYDLSILRKHTLAGEGYDDTQNDDDDDSWCEREAIPKEKKTWAVYI